MKAMILAAGLGTRLRPLTDELPKALLPVANRPVIEYVLEMLRRAGVDEVVVNLHHLGGAIRDALGDRYAGRVTIRYSVEPEILGTGGGIRKVQRFFDDEPFLVANADTLMDVDLAAAVRSHRRAGAAATMVVREGESPYGGVETDGGGMVRRVLGRGAGGDLRNVMFAGVHVLGRALFRHLPDRPFSCINRDGYGAMLEAGERVASFAARGYWREIGTAGDYFAANMDFLRGLMPAHCRRMTGAGRPPARGARGATFVEPVLIGRGCVIGEGARIGPEAVLGAGCEVGRGCALERIVALPGARFGEGEAVSGRIRTARSELRLPA
ncbi:MAG: NDP-sugar synthase [bacterium]|nr:NDP-sugar synthase [bacterium]